MAEVNKSDITMLVYACLVKLKPYHSQVAFGLDNLLSTHLVFITMLESLPHVGFLGHGLFVVLIMALICN